MLEKLHLEKLKLFLSSYIGYILMPARYPFYVLHDPVPLEGLFAAEALWGLLIDTLEINKFDAFPSGHTEVSLIVLFYALRYSRPAFCILFPVISLLLFSTVYLRYHYVVDLVAGALLAAVVVVGTELYARAKSPSRKFGSA